MEPLLEQVSTEYETFIELVEKWTQAGADTTEIDEWIAAVKAEDADAANDGAMATAGTFAAAIFATTLALF